MKHPLTGKGGKGSTPREVDQDKFNENFDRIFGKKEDKKRCWEGGTKETCDCPDCGPSLISTKN